MAKSVKRTLLALALTALLAVAVSVLAAGGRQTAAAEGTDDRYTLDTAGVPTDTLTFAPAVGSNMLYQQNKPVPVWGYAPAGCSLTVTLSHKDGGGAEVLQTTADGSGCFWVEFAPHAASYQEYKLTATDGTATITAESILFGELFLACGQSNMGVEVQYCSNADEIREGAHNPYLRVFLSPEVAGAANLPYRPAVYWPGGMWARGDSYVGIASASAVAYNFALSLYDRLNANGATVPVGILNAPKGATSIEAWLSRPSVDDDEAVRTYLSERNRLLSEEEYNQAGGNNYNQVSGLFNAKIAPLSPLYVKGILWYQGENNVGNEVAGRYYQSALSLLRRDWSRWFNAGKEELPLFFVQPTPHNYQYEPEALAYLWEGMEKAYRADAEHCSMVTTYDVPPDWYNERFTYRSPIHPIVKKPIGRRLAEFAFHRLYGGKGAVSSPVWEDVSFDGRAATVSFQNAQGLQTTDGSDVRGFTLCGANRVFYPAQARILPDGKVAVTSEWVRQPVAVAYGFSTMIGACNLCSDEGYPVAPFRSDRVASQYYHPKDWQTCDALQWFVSRGSGRDEEFGKLRDAYTSAQTVELVAKQDGFYGGAVQLNYTLRGRETFWFAPVLHHSGVMEQLERYDTVSFKVRNPQARKVDLASVEVTLADRRTGRLTLRGGTDSSATIAAQEGWQTFAFDLTAMETASGRVELDTLRASITELKLTFKDYLSGSLLIDDFAFGNAADWVGPLDETPAPPDGTDPPPSPSQKSGCGCGGALSSVACAGLAVSAALGAALLGWRKKRRPS